LGGIKYYYEEMIDEIMAAQNADLATVLIW